MEVEYKFCNYTIRNVLVLQAALVAVNPQHFQPVNIIVAGVLVAGSRSLAEPLFFQFTI